MRPLCFLDLYFANLKLVSSAFALLFTEISVVRGTEISVKSSAKADETSFSRHG